MAAATDSRRTSAVAESMASRPYTDATWMTQSGTHPMGKGQILFTGPSGIRDYKVNVVTDDRMVGIGTMSQEGTSDLQYIWRGAPGAPPPRRRSQWVGEVGWFIPPYHDTKNTLSGNQIQLKVFRKAQEEKYTHRFQEPWYLAPNDPDYKQNFPFTQGSKRNWRAPGQQRSAEQLPPRPHTSFHSNDSRLPNVNNNAPPSSRPFTVQPPSSESISRPASGQSAHSYSAHSYTPPGSRPGSGGGHESAYSSRSRGSQSTLRSRGSSQTSHPSRRRITPAATSVSSVYRAPTSDPDY
ncbi:uncharacterized protein LOC592577 [Strongylocentrotus purpuratus]|uniref:Uncharacterized protein n=1 Tax=Strongylocentrotus purpuratus TaxID=7668 RepID=A0A7M7RHI6_STRPU|nr:uncharacterized protein LOC592577 [Strongylocentrotus purpuratus]8SNB_9V Chain 9V, C4orf45 [Strongylocentrotus purpuratus]8SNB_9W Chain 9W, C4orf45 [Strongylocentrotus purpuratus]|eukprot:XP_797184.1 PREDICTED: uncharacterized protein LOC592577 isoform X1 [Strongylocentrotus purpuratus]